MTMVRYLGDGPIIVNTCCVKTCLRYECDCDEEIDREATSIPEYTIIMLMVVVLTPAGQSYSVIMALMPGVNDSRPGQRVQV